ncbi:MAG TPA: WD40 repeat domain-containing protein, partial [Gemmataceae bacterium]
ELRRFALPKELPGVRLRAGEEFKFREVRSVGFTPDGKHVFAAGVFGAVVLWDVQAPDRVKLLPFSEGEGFFGAGGTVYQAAVSPDGKQLAAGGRDGMIYVWDLAKQELVRKVKGHTAAVRGVAFSPDGKRLLTGSDDQTVRLWDLKSGKVVQYSFDGAIGSVAFTPDGRRVLFGGEKLTLWDLPSETQVWHSQFADARVTRAAVTPDGRFAVAALSDGNLHVADLTTGRAVLSARAHAGPVADVAVSPDGRFALSAGGNPILPNPRPVTEADFALRLWELPRVPGEFLEPPQGIGVRPLPENPLTGAVTAVRDNQIELSLGRNDGIGPGDRLEVYRLAPTPLYCGRARVINASPERAVAELEGPLYEPPRVGDRVAKIPPKR